MARNDEEIRKFVREMAVEEAEKWVDSAISSLERDLEEMKRARNSVKEALSEERLGVDGRGVASSISTFVHMAAQVGRNMRLDLAVNIAAKLA